MKRRGISSSLQKLSQNYTQEGRKMLPSKQDISCCRTQHIQNTDNFTEIIPKGVRGRNLRSLRLSGIFCGPQTMHLLLKRWSELESCLAKMIILIKPLGEMIDWFCLLMGSTKTLNLRQGKHKKKKNQPLNCCYTLYG